MHFLIFPSEAEKEKEGGSVNPTGGECAYTDHGRNNCLSEPHGCWGCAGSDGRLVGWMPSEMLCGVRVTISDLGYARVTV